MEHDIRDVSQYETELAKMETARRRRAEFGKFVDDLRGLMQKGLISPEEYRRRIKWWSDTHEDA